MSGVIAITSIHDLSMAMYLSEIQLDLLQTSDKLAVEAINMSTALLASLAQVSNSKRKRAMHRVYGKHCILSS